MFHMLISISRCLYNISGFAYENKQNIISCYSVFDATKFIFYASDRLGIINAIKKRIVLDQPTNPVLLEISSSEETIMGDFEIIN